MPFQRQFEVVLFLFHLLLPEKSYCGAVPPHNGLMQPEPDSLWGCAPHPLFMGLCAPDPQGLSYAKKVGVKPSLTPQRAKPLVSRLPAERGREISLPLSTPPLSAPIGVLYYKTGSQSSILFGKGL